MKRALLLLLSIFVWRSLAGAEEATPKPAPELSNYLNQLQLKLDHAAQRANQPNASGSSVIGLRGSKQEPISKQLYWKGRAGNTPISPEEVKTFRTAIEEAQAGQTEKAAAGLQAFLAKYPKSGLKEDAEDTLKRLTSVPHS